LLSLEGAFGIAAFGPVHWSISAISRMLQAASIWGDWKMHLHVRQQQLECDGTEGVGLPRKQKQEKSSFRCRRLS